MSSLADMVKERLKKKEIPPEQDKPSETINITSSKKTVVNTAEKNAKTEVNESLELNLIKSIYANRFGSTTNKTKAHMIRKIKNAWSF